MRRMSDQRAAIISKLLSVWPAMVAEVDLIDAVWPGPKPMKPKNALQSLVHDLRGDGWNIVNQFNHGYAMISDPIVNSIAQDLKG